MEAYEETLRQHGLDLSSMIQIQTGGNEPPMAVFDVSESEAKCETCLELRSDYLRRQWRKMGVGAAEAPYSFPIEQLEKSIQNGNCNSCRLVGEAVHKIRGIFPFSFKRVQLEYLGVGDGTEYESIHRGLDGLSLCLTMKYPDDLSLEDATRAIKDPEMKIKSKSGVDLEKAETECDILSPQYEIYTAVEPSKITAAVAKSSSYNAIQCRPHRSGNTGSDQSREWALGKFRDCLANHPQCSVGGSWNSPKRVLDLGEPGASTSQDNVKIYESDETVQAEYVCLSHCWGKENEQLGPLETTRQNLDEHKKHIPWGKLPKSFQDAITFTRGLGIRYLWIDSLCIIQDDEDDWKIEAGKMASVYQNASVTLSAAAAKNSHEGLFRKAMQHEQLECDVFPSPVFIRRFPDPDFFASDYSSDSSARAPARSALMSRGWVFQERLLSRRLLLFTPTELYWECSTKADAESGYPWSAHTIKRHWQREAEADKSPEALTHVWHSLVEDFTALQLTRHTDLLPSIAGLAKNLQPYLETAEYGAGFWSSTFISDLLWKRAGIPMGGRKNTGAVEDYKEIGNPSWSWASTYGPKSFEGRVFGELASLKSMRSAEGDRFMTSKISITITGFMIPAQLGSLGIEINKFPSIGWSADNADYDWDAPGEHQITGLKADGSADHRLYAMPLAATENSGTLEEDLAIQLLILHQDKDYLPRFRRVGLCSVNLLLIWPNQVMLEDKDLLLKALDKGIAYGESILQEDGSYRKDEEARSMWFFEFDASSRRDRYFENVAYFQFSRFGLGHTLGMEFEEFYGLPHLNWMKERRQEEMERIEEWPEMKKAGELPEKLHVTIT